MSVRIANCSGFYGDRITAMREVLDGSSAGGRVDVITGDYLAELTMLILGRDKLRDGSLGYAKTFVRQLEDCLGDALERGVKIVTNAGGLNPQGLAARIEEVASGLGLAPTIGYVAGDDLTGRSGEPALASVLDRALTANAYLGAFGIADALQRGADVVVTGRVTDASVVVGPAIAAHGWTPDSLDELAGAVVAGHVIECGTQATGGNFSGFLSMPPAARARPLGFPVAEVAADGSSVITKHDDTGGVVSVDTVTAQLCYEIQSAVYLNPDVSVDLDSVRLSQDAPDRVLVSGVRGGPPPERLKVCVNTLGGHRNQMEMVLTGLDVEAKEEWVRAQVEARLDPRPETVVWTRGRLPVEDPGTEEDAATSLRIAVQDTDAAVVGRSFSNAVVELVLGSYPGFHVTSPPGSGSPYGVYRPEYVDRALVEHVSVVGGERVVIPDPDHRWSSEEVADPDHRWSSRPEPLGGGRRRDHGDSLADGDRRVPLGTFVHARSGDKGGDANVGLWVGQPAAGEDPALRDARVTWLLDLITPETIKDLLPEARDLDVEVHPLPHLGGVNVLIHGLLGEGVAATTRFDPQAKAVGEWIRARQVDVPEELL